MGGGAVDGVVGAGGSWSGGGFGVCEVGGGGGERGSGAGVESGTGDGCWIITSGAGIDSDSVAGSTGASAGMLVTVSDASSRADIELGSSSEYSAGGGDAGSGIVAAAASGTGDELMCTTSDERCKRWLRLRVRGRKVRRGWE